MDFENAHNGCLAVVHSSIKKNLYGGVIMKGLFCPLVALPVGGYTNQEFVRP